MSKPTPVTESEPILLVGAGKMAIEYARVLIAFGISPMVLGRGETSAQRFFDETGIRPTTGLLSDQLAALGATKPAAAIVTVNAQQLAEVGAQLVGQGMRRLLIEKPAALDLTEARDLLATVQAQGADVFVAYNRRFMASILAAKAIIAADGGAISVKFDFSEPARRIATLNKPERELKTWFYGNSTHVLDIAFHLAGAPLRLSGDVSGGSVIDLATGLFTGHGMAAKGCHVTWHANWMAPGRWGVEVLTGEHRLILQPLEKLRKQTHTGFAEVEHPIDDADDLAFKPGLLRQTRAFLTGDGAERLLPLAEHVRLMQAYEAIRTGTSWQA